VEIQGVVENKLSPQEPKVIFKETLFEVASDEESPRNRNSQYVFVPRDHQLKVGDQIDLVGIAKDNFHNPANRKLDPQLAFSQAMRVRIVETETPDENSQETKEPSTSDDPKIAQAQNPSPKQKVDWDKFRDKPKNDPSKSNPTNKNQDPSEKNQSEPSQSRTPISGQGGSDSGDQKSGSNQEDTKGQSNPSNASHSGQENPNNSDANGNSASSNDVSDDSRTDSKPSRNQSGDSSANQDRGAFEKIQKFLKEKQQENPVERTDGNSQMNDQAGSDQAGSDQAGSDQAGSDKAGSDKAGSDKAGSVVSKRVGPHLSLSPKPLLLTS
ncbi:MAG: hypothetical protein ACKO9Q_13210, partial [Pirellula sp.]